MASTQQQSFFQSNSPSPDPADIFLFLFSVMPLWSSGTSADSSNSQTKLNLWLHHAAQTKRLLLWHKGTVSISGIKLRNQKLCLKNLNLETKLPSGRLFHLVHNKPVQETPHPNQWLCNVGLRKHIEQSESNYEHIWLSTVLQLCGCRSACSACRLDSSWCETQIQNQRWWT